MFFRPPDLSMHNKRWFKCTFVFNYSRNSTGSIINKSTLKYINKGVKSSGEYTYI